MTSSTTPPPGYELDITGQRMVQQFSTLLPQVHLTLVSILQGLALVVLFTNTKPPAGFSWNDITSALYAHHWYVPHIASLLMVVTAWIEYVYGIFYLHWPVKSLWVTLQFLIVVPEVAAFSSVDQIGPWMLWLGILSLFGGAFTFINRLFVSRTLYRTDEDWRRVTSTNALYWALGIILSVSGWLRATENPVFKPPLTFLTADLTTQIGSVFDFVAPIAILCAIIFNLWLDDYYFGRTIETILKEGHSPYTLRSGIISHRMPTPALTSASDKDAKKEG
jgi:hypothetical protein